MAGDPGDNLRRPESGEAPFYPEELFFSRTDPRGVILCGNTVFQRVADYPWDRLLNAPHKMIRHADMPRAVFWLLWQTIQQGQPIGAYVKNMARDGLHYWVFAVVTPVEGGYLSVRLKPTSPLLATVAAEYAKLLEREKSEALSPAESCAILTARLGELGFPSYGAFMAAALAAEVEARCRAIKRPVPEWLLQFRTITETVEQVSKETLELSTAFESIRGIPYNMRILASRLEAAGGPISVISANYGVLSEEIGGWMHGFADVTNGAFAEIRRAVETGLFLQCTALIQQEVTQQFRHESGFDPRIDPAREMELLTRQHDDYDRRAHEGMRSVMVQAERFSQRVRDMKRLITGLGATRMMCKIEGARLKGSHDGLAGVISQLDHFQDDIEQRLSRIDDLNRLIQRAACAMVPECADGSSRARHAAE